MKLKIPITVWSSCRFICLPSEYFGSPIFCLFLILCVCFLFCRMSLTIRLTNVELMQCGNIEPGQHDDWCGGGEVRERQWWVYKIRSIKFEYLGFGCHSDSNRIIIWLIWRWSSSKLWMTQSNKNTTKKRIETKRKKQNTTINRTTDRHICGDGGGYEWICNDHNQPI